MAVTLQQIADRVGVSKMTVSRVLNNKASGQVSPALVQKILECAGELNYTSNSTVSKLSRLKAENMPRSGKVVLLVPHADFLKKKQNYTVYAREIFEGIFDAISQLGASAEIVPVSPDNTPWNVSWSRVNAIENGSKVIAAGPWFMVSLLELTAKNCQIALLQSDDFWRNRFAPLSSKWATFTICQKDGCMLLTRELLKRNCRNTALLMPEDVAEEPDNPLVGGYVEEMAKNNLQPRLLAGSPEILAEAYRNKPFDGLIVHLRASEVESLSGSFQKIFGLPEDLPVVFTDFEIASDRFSHGQSVVYPLRQMAWDAVKTLLAADFIPGERPYNGTLRRI